uniref:Uncharacterized protein n=1 Tax=Mycena chlorophos TaxID=658473 RepID=A0ABQ0LS06_MYCCL|nr:predicted protein [Mycena chlorophos]
MKLSARQANCFASGLFYLQDFQGRVLDLAGSVNPVITYTRNSPDSANQQACNLAAFTDSWLTHSIFSGSGRSEATLVEAPNFPFSPTRRPPAWRPSTTLRRPDLEPCTSRFPW